MNGYEEAFAIVQNLAAELSAGNLELPSLPWVVVKIRNDLAQHGFDVPRLARLVVKEPALAGSVLNMANSVTYRRAGSETLDLKVAIPRIGGDRVQAMALRFAMRQLQQNVNLGRSKALLEQEWELGLRIAATSYLVAERSKQVNPDEAMLVGLIHNVGRIYLLSRADAHPALFDSPESLMELVNNWHPQVGHAIVESWGLPEIAVEAVALQAEDDDIRRGPLTYVLRIALAVGELDAAPDPEQVEELAQWRACRALKLQAGDIAAIAASQEATRIDLGLTD
jgi:HD-like signal output (HDOD) protein